MFIRRYLLWKYPYATSPRARTTTRTTATIRIQSFSPRNFCHRSFHFAAKPSFLSSGISSFCQASSTPSEGSAFCSRADSAFSEDSAFCSLACSARFSASFLRLSRFAAMSSSSSLASSASSSASSAFSSSRSSSALAAAASCCLACLLASAALRFFFCCFLLFFFFVTIGTFFCKSWFILKHINA